MKLSVRNLENQELREIEVPAAVFEYPFNGHLIHTAVQAYLAGLRRGTHKTKTRAEVSGSGKKLRRQKGAGRARPGDIPNPKWRPGGGGLWPEPPRPPQPPHGRREQKPLAPAPLLEVQGD